MSAGAPDSFDIRALNDPPKRAAAVHLPRGSCEPLAGEGTGHPTQASLNVRVYFEHHGEPAEFRRWPASFRKLAQHVAHAETHEEGSVFSFTTGLPLSLFNGCVVTQEAQPGELAASLAWVAARDVPFCVWIAEKHVAGLAEVPTRYGLKPAVSLYPGMVLHPIPGAPAPDAGVSVVPIFEPSLDEFIGVLEESGLRAELAQRLISPAFAADPDVRLFVGRLDGKPVGTSIAIRSQNASGVYNVGTLPEARRRGVGSAVTWAAVGAGSAWGCDTAVLQSSVMAISMYEDMGFRTVAPYVTFAQSSVR